MLIDNVLDFKIIYELILCKPDETQLCILDEAFNISYNAKFPTTDELEFSIPFYVNINNIKTINPNYSLINGDYLILLNRKNEFNNSIVNSKYFIIRNIKEIGGDKEIKNIHCYSREFELNNKLIREYKFTSRKIYSPINELDNDGYQRGVMNYITTLTSWSLDVDSFLNQVDLLNKYRAFDLSELTLFDFLINKIQKVYNCIFIFDTINKKISVKLIEDLNINNGLYINEYNYMKTINQEIKYDEIITRLYCYGKDGISINSINPTGVPYIENFDFFKTTTFMSQELINALNNYTILLDTQNGTFSILYNELLTLYDIQRTLLGELNDLFAGKYIFDLDTEKDVLIENGLYQIQDAIDVAIKNNDDLTQLNIDLSNKELEILNKQAELDQSVFTLTPLTNREIEIIEILSKHLTFDYSGIISNQTNINNKLTEISNFRWLISKENPINFTANNLIELDFFIREKTLSDSTYETVEDLYDEAINQLLKISNPPISFNIDVVDFLQIVEGKVDSSKLILGNLVYISFDKFGIDIQVRLVGYSHNYDDKKLTLSFSNKNSLDDPYVYLVELQKNAITTSTTIDMSKFKWDKSQDNTNAISDLINNNINTTLQKVLAGKNQDIAMDRRGIWLREKDENGVFKPEQLRIINNAIVLSDNYFQSSKIAISPTGINSEMLYSKIVISETGLFNSIEIFDSGAEPVVEIGKYLKNINGIDTEVKGQRINSGNFEVIGGVNGVNIDPTNGIIVNKSDDLFRVVINATNGIKIQGRLDAINEWNDTNNKFYVGIDGNLKFSGMLEGANGDFSGSVNCTTLKLNGQNILTEDSLKIKGAYIDKINANQIDVLTGKITTAQIENLIVGTNVTMGSNAFISWNNVTNQPIIPSSYNQLSDIKPLTYIDGNGIYTGTLTANQINAVEVIASSLITKYNTTTVTNVYKDTYGGRMKIYDNNGYLNAVIGVESGAGDNIGGSLILFNDSPYDTAPDYNSYRRIELGISSSYNAGVINIRGSNATTRVNIYGSSNIGDFGIITLRNSSETETIRLSASDTSFFINNLSCYSTLSASSLSVSNNISCSTLSANSLSVVNNISCSTLSSSNSLSCGSLSTNGGNIATGNGWISTYEIYTDNWGGSTVNNTIIMTPGAINFWFPTGLKHVFYDNGTKLGGSIETPNFGNLGMFPIDSPRALIQDIIYNIDIDKKMFIEIDKMFLDTMIEYIVFPSNRNINILEKLSNGFYVNGNGNSDFLIIGKRFDSKDKYFIDLNNEVNPISKKIKDSDMGIKTDEDKLKNSKIDNKIIEDIKIIKHDKELLVIG